MRIEGWETKLSKYIEKVTLKNFKWGTCDCLIFVSDACKIICKTDPMKKKKRNDPDTIRGLYKSEEEAYILIKKHRRSIPEIMDIHFKRISPAFAGRGDVVLMRLKIGKTFGVVGNRGMALFKTQDLGLLSFPASEAKIAWRVE